MKLLDVCCGAGGASVGYHRAGFEVVGVDLAPQKNYPYKFIQAEGLMYLADHGKEYDVIHVSPPCQSYSKLSVFATKDRYPQLIEPFRNMLKMIGVPYVIENVVGAPLNNPLVLCGTMFGLRVHRHRLFEMKPALYWYPSMCNKKRVKPAGEGKKLGVYCGDQSEMVTVAGHMFSRRSGSDAMGIDWMTRDELAEAIPPAYTEYIGRWMIENIRS